MSSSSYKHGIYITGINPISLGLSSEDWISQKIGQAGNNQINRIQRLEERRRQVPGSEEHAFFPTHQGDKHIRKWLCTTYPMKFRPNRGTGHDVIDLQVKDLPFLLEQTKRYFNAINAGLSPDKGKLDNFLPRQEQTAFINAASSFFANPTNNGREFLMAGKPRFGKTHSSYWLSAHMNCRLILILTGRPTDTKQSWIDALDHKDFSHWNANFIDASAQGKEPITLDPEKMNIVFASLQDTRMIENAFKEKFKHFPEYIFDLLIKDECHLHFDTEKTKEVISKLKCKHILNLSGTPFRALLEDRFDEDAVFHWSYLDEQRARLAEIVALGQERAEKEGQYFGLSPMKIFTILLTNELYKDADLFSDDEGFTFNKLFATEEINGQQTFINETAVAAFINALCRGLVMPYSDQAHNSRQYKSINLKHSLWFLPGVSAVKCIADMLKKHFYYKNFDVVIAAGDNGNEGNDTTELVRNRIIDIEVGKNKKHTGTITLSCGKLSHGVSIPEWGSVFNFSDMKSAQLYFQLIFRSQTPWVGKKRECYVFDFNPNRTLTHINALAEAMSKTKDRKIILTEILNVFNVLCYEGTEFRPLDASELLEKLEAGFGKATSIAGLQNLFADLINSIEFDPELEESLDDIEGLFSKTNTIEVNKNDIANGKNSKRLNDKDDDDLDTDLDNEKDKQSLSDEQKKARLKSAMMAIPLYFSFTTDTNFNDFVNNLDTERNRKVCKEIVGLQAKRVKKELEILSQDKKKQINEGILRFRVLEQKVMK